MKANTNRTFYATYGIQQVGFTPNLLPSHISANNLLSTILAEPAHVALLTSVNVPSRFVVLALFTLLPSSSRRRPRSIMAFSLVIDDTSLVLLLCLVTALSLSIYISRSYQPLIHPLILSRQADVSQVRQPKESAIYRNANSPSGFDLALRPRKDINDIADLLKHASPTHTSRTLYGQAKTNTDVAGDATAFATGFLKLSSAPVTQTALAIAADTDTYETLIALLANSHTSASSRFHSVVLPPTTSLPTALPAALANAGARSVIGLYTTASTAPSTFHLNFLDSSALIVVPTADLAQVEQQAAEHFGGAHRLRIYAFDHVVEMGSRGSLLGPDASTRDSIHHTQSHFWNALAKEWVAVQHANLIAGVTSQLAMFPADKIPTSPDHLFVEASSVADSPASVLMASRTPAGLTLVLMALYTGSSLTAGSVTCNTDDGPSMSPVFITSQPSLLYASAQGASSIACALTCLTRSSPIALFAARSKLYTLRTGSFARQGLADRLVYASSRTQAGCQRVRNLLIAGSGDTVAQALLDSLRSHLGCAVLNAYLPSLSIGAALTGPISSTHAFDLQAFAEHEHGPMQVPAHVGPPSVAVELKLVQTQAATDNGFTISGARLDGYQGDPMGEIVVQGYLAAGVNGDWVATGDFGAIRSNGTLVVLRGSQESDPVPVPTLNSHKPVLRQRRAKTGAKGLAATALVASLCLLVGIPAVSASILEKRASLNGTMTNVAKMGMLTGQRASWEQGVGQSALLELDFPGYSVFTSSSGGPAFRPGHERNPTNPPVSVVSMAYHAASRQDSLGRLAFQITGDEARNAGSSLDGASAGSEVLLAAWIAGQINSQTGEQGTGFYIEAAQRTLDLVLNRTPKARSGAISHRYTEVALWSDAMYMMPPFVAYYGMLTRNQSLMQTAYDQIRLYRNSMRITDGAGQGLWGHILLGNGTWSDGGAWCTGNGWVSAGMLRVLATIEQSQSSLAMVDQKQDLIDWINEILDAAYPLLDDRALLWHNYIDDENDFFDSAGSALLAYSTYRLASMVPGNTKWIDKADQIYRSLATSLDTIGQFRTGYPVTDVLAFTHQGETSSESLSFLMLMSAAKRDYENNDVVRVTTSATASASAAPASTLQSTLPLMLVASLVAIFISHL